ncbi:MAG: hypothetical protein QNI93_04525 [Kiloniellales bacterium]|nr:hypothetical protein [Kiloniellales bacterium]MDJ0981018.1 hypothetical protein [Kiloniellales bacterium]
MTAYLFWHRPFSDVAQDAYEAALVDFHRALVARGCPGFEGSASYRISATPWLGGRAGYEDWNFVESSAGLDPLNQAAVAPEMWDVHAGISGNTEVGHGGIYYHILGEADPRVLTRTAWLTRPRGIRYEAPLREIVAQVESPVSVWRKQMVLGPAPEFALLGDAGLALDLPEGWTAQIVERSLLQHGRVSG